MTITKHPGRPPLPPNRKRHNAITIRLTDEELDFVKGLAELKKMSMTDLLLSMVPPDYLKSDEEEITSHALSTGKIVRLTPVEQRDLLFQLMEWSIGALKEQFAKEAEQ